MGVTNEAAFYLSFLPDSYDKYIVMLYSYNEKKKETLAQYYYRTNGHLIGKTKVAEYNPENNELRVISVDNQKPQVVVTLSDIQSIVLHVKLTLALHPSGVVENV